MDEKEKFKAEIDAKLVQSGQTLLEMKTKKKQRDANHPHLDLDTTEEKHKQAVVKARELDASDSEKWTHLRSELNSLMANIDEDLRQALAYFG